ARSSEAASSLSMGRNSSTGGAPDARRERPVSPHVFLCGASRSNLRAVATRPEPFAEHTAPWRRQQALVRVLRRRLRRGWLVRLGRFGAWYTAVGAAALAVWLTHGERGVNGASLLHYAMGWLTV